MAETSTKAQRESFAIGPLLISLVVALVWSILILPTTIRDAAQVPHDVGPQHDTGAVLWGGAIGTATGSSVAISLVVWAIAYFAFVRRRSPSRGVIHLPIILGVTFALNMAVVSLAIIGAQSEAAQQRTAVAEMRSALNSAVKARNGGGAIDTSVKSSGTAGVLEGATKQFLAQVLTDRQNYVAELHGLGFPQLLSPQGLGTENLAEADARIGQARQVAAKYKALTRTRVEAYRDSILQSQLSDADKAQFKSGFDAGFARSQANSDAVWGMEDAIFNEAGDVVNLLRRHRGGWQLRGGVLGFSDPQLLSRYNADVEQLHSLSQQEKLLQQQALQRTDQRLSQISPGG